MFCINKSTNVTAAIDSTTTTARGTIIGSWRPEISISIFSPEVFTVFCGCEMEGVGFIAARKMIGLPSLRPPRIPPLWLVCLVIWPSLERNGSLLQLPFEEETENPGYVLTALATIKSDLAEHKYHTTFAIHQAIAMYEYYLSIQK